LRRKSYPEERKIGDLRSILLDGAASSRLRTAAAVELARLGTPAAQEVLLAETENKDEVVSRSVKLGGQEFTRLRGKALQAPERPPVLPPGLAEGMSRDVGPILPVDAEKAQPIRLRKTLPVTAGRIVADLNAETPALALVGDMTYTLRCGDRILGFVPTRETFDALQGADAPGEPVVAGVVAEQETVETNKWTAYYFLVASRAEKTDEVSLRLVTRRGRVAMVGTATLAPDQASFSLVSVTGPGNAPVEIRGVYRSNRLQVAVARSEPRVTQQLTPANRR
jgi:hypothetical protein